MALTKPAGSNLAAKAGAIFAYPVAQGQLLFNGQLVVLGVDGYAYNPLVNDRLDEAQQLVVGYCMDGTIDTTRPNLLNGVPQQVTVRVRRDLRLLLDFLGMPTPAIVGQWATLFDNNTVQLYAAGQCPVLVGRIAEISGNQVFVDLADRPTRTVSTVR